ncbi:transcription factor BIM2-like isoform X2 [Hordeum vulgare subsp. vulgare]|uniref:BHLH domain-containing protein n=1 Tax=Hordeum vulgare subsp. vulgare TaxID=112509 RepID=A0A8I7BCC1_HORVV|nr:transcription factor BIM2-like isoform X2 [Hordeum vulgare subsp. vulgare]
MELFQGEEPAHDFLSLRAGGSPPFTRRQRPNQQAALKSLEPANGGGTAGGAGDGEASTATGLGQHVLPGGVGTFSIRQLPHARSMEEAGTGGDASVSASHGSRMEVAHEARPGIMVRSAPPTPTMWQDSSTDNKRSRGSRAEGRSSGSSADQDPSSPRSKHSATEQRRRTKINDRLDILRDLLPNCDQKRDKASFLLEVIEYIRLLQEKCQKYESGIPEQNNVDANCMPWDKVYYRSRWRNTQNISQVQGGGLSATTEDMNKEQYSSKGIAGAPAASLFSTQSVRETSAAPSSSQNIAENSMPSNQLPWLSMSTMNQNCDASNRVLTKHDTQRPQDDSQSLSSAYSQGLLHKLKEALQKSGVDPSQAKISVEINMDRRTRANAHIHDSSKANKGKEPVQVTKRLRCD